MAKQNSYWQGTAAPNRQKGAVPSKISNVPDPLFAREEQNQNETKQPRAYMVKDLGGKAPEITLETNTAQGATTTDGFKGFKGVADQRQDINGESFGPDENLSYYAKK